MGLVVRGIRRGAGRMLGMEIQAPAGEEGGKPEGVGTHRSGVRERRGVRSGRRVRGARRGSARSGCALCPGAPLTVRIPHFAGWEMWPREVRDLPCATPLLRLEADSVHFCLHQSLFAGSSHELPAMEQRRPAFVGWGLPREAAGPELCARHNEGPHVRLLPSPGWIQKNCPVSHKQHSVQSLSSLI